MMRVRLLKDARIRHKAGETVEVTPEEYLFLTSVNAAVPAAKKEKITETPAPKRGSKKK